MVIDPLAKGQPTIIKRESIDLEKQSEISLMPQGLLNKLSGEEILDLIAFMYAKGNKDHDLFESHQH